MAADQHDQADNKDSFIFASHGKELLAYQVEPTSIAIECYSKVFI